MPSRSAGVSTRHVREANTRAVLDVLWDGPAQTGSDLIAATGLTRATVHDVCDDLVRLGWVAEIANSREVGDYTKGRPARRYAFDPLAGVVVGVDAGQRRLTSTVADLRGQVLGSHSSTWSLEHPRGAARADAVAESVETVLEESGIDAAHVLAASIGVPAPVGRTGRTVIDSNPYWNAVNPDFREHLEARWEWTTLVENDANLAALAEGWQGAGVACADYVTMLSGERFGAGVVLDGRLLRGSRGGAGELAVLDRVTGVGSSLGLAALARDWAGEALLDPAQDTAGWPGPADLDAPAVFAAAAAGDPVAADIVERLGRRLAVIVATVGEVFDPELVVVAGAVAAGSAPLIEVVEREFAAEASERPRVCASTLGDGIVTLGAIKQGLDHVRATALDIELPML